MMSFDDARLTGNNHATRAVQCFFIRQDVLNTNSLPQAFDDNNIGALYGFLKVASQTNANIVFPSTAQIEGWYVNPAQDGVFVQVWDASFATVAQNDQIPVNVI